MSILTFILQQRCNALSSEQETKVAIRAINKLKRKLKKYPNRKIYGAYININDRIVKAVTKVNGQYKFAKPTYHRFTKFCNSLLNYLNRK